MLLEATIQALRRHGFGKPPEPLPEDFSHPFHGNLDPRRRLIFVHIPKNAGTSIAKCLGLGGTTHHSYVEYRGFLGEELASTFSYYTVVREPYDRFLSLYHYARMDESMYHSAVRPEAAVGGKHPQYDLLVDASPEDCADLLLEGKIVFDSMFSHWRPQTFWLPQDLSEIEVLRLESLSRDFKRLCRKFRLRPKTPLKQINTSPNQARATPLSTQCKDKIYEFYQADFEQLGYPR